MMINPIFKLKTTFGIFIIDLRSIESITSTADGCKIILQSGNIVDLSFNDVKEQNETVETIYARMKKINDDANEMLERAAEQVIMGEV